MARLFKEIGCPGCNAEFKTIPTKIGKYCPNCKEIIFITQQAKKEQLKNKLDEEKLLEKIKEALEGKERNDFLDDFLNEALDPLFENKSEEEDFITLIFNDKIGKCNGCGINCELISGSDKSCSDCVGLINIVGDFELDVSQGKELSERSLLIQLREWMTEKKEVRDKVFDTFLDNLLKKLIPDKKKRENIIRSV